MDSIRVAKVENVLCRKLSILLKGTLHLTAHHLIFCYDDNAQEEMWVPYPLLSLVSRLPQSLKGQTPLMFHTRTFESFLLLFSSDSEAQDVFDSVKELTVAASVEKLYAFYYAPNPPIISSDGWNIYNPRQEYGRMGIGTRSKTWRFTDINKDYALCSTYPSKLVVPTRISDSTLQYASKFRSKARIPALTYLHWANYGSITRSSQPMVGLTQNRSIQDEKLIEAIFQTHLSPESRVSSGVVYGATSTNLIVDARPTANAMANTAKGAGTENMEHYKDSRKVYLGIDHIHTMRESLNKVVEALREADNIMASFNSDIEYLLPPDRQALRKSNWLRHISIILEGTLIITKNVHVNSSHVLIHCSDGWDRTSQLSALSQLCLDPFYRTLRGFQILIEKDWASFGHKFLDRCGHLSSDKFFVTPIDHMGNGDPAQAFLASVQNRFASQGHLKETSPVFHQFLECVRQIQRQFPDRFEFNERYLRQLYHHVFSCQFGTFLFNCERERREGASRVTVSVWDYLNSREEVEKNTNVKYNPSLDDTSRRDSDMGVLLLNPKDVRFWHQLYGRTDEEMNGRLVPDQVLVKEPELMGIAPTETDPVLIRAKTPSSVPLPPSPAMSPANTRVSTPSLPSVPHSSMQGRLATTERQDDFHLSSSTSPSLSLQSRSFTSGQPPKSPNPTDLFSANNMRSMWGKISSNASAAISIVQEAYGTAAKEWSGSGGKDAREAELRDRDTLSAWGEDSSTANPWSTLQSDIDQTDANFENPWSSVRSSPAVDTPSGESSWSQAIPLDPTIARPTRLPSDASAIHPAQERVTAESRTDSPSGPPIKAALGADPLGVGL